MFYIKKLLNYLRKLFFSRELELSVIGLQNAGKSTLINSFQTGEFMEDSIPTVGVNIREVKQGKVVNEDIEILGKSIVVLPIVFYLFLMLLLEIILKLLNSHQNKYQLGTLVKVYLYQYQAIKMILKTP